MRPLFKILVLALLVAIISSFATCRYLNSKMATNSTADTSRCGPCLGYNNVSNTQKLDFNLLRAITYNYQHDVDASGVINPANTIKTRSIWIPLDRLKQFIHDIESNTCATCPNQELGVRFYFGNYPSDDNDWTTGFANDLGNLHTDLSNRGIAPEYLGRTSLFMVPTVKVSGVNKDFDPSNRTFGCNGGYDINSIMEVAGVDTFEFNQPAYFLHHQAGYGITALTASNHGEACPPPMGNCQTVGSFAGFDYW